MSHDGADHPGGTAGVKDSVFSRWARGDSKRGRTNQDDRSPVYMILTCPTTFRRTVFYIPAPCTPPPRRKK